MYNHDDSVNEHDEKCIIITECSSKCFVYYYSESDNDFLETCRASTLLAELEDDELPEPDDDEEDDDDENEDGNEEEDDEYEEQMVSVSNSLH